MQVDLVSYGRDMLILCCSKYKCWYGLASDTNDGLVRINRKSDLITFGSASTEQELGMVQSTELNTRRRIGLRPKQGVFQELCPV